MNEGNKWLTFATKMKWILFGTVATVVAAGGNAATDTFSVDQNPWVALVPAVVTFLLGYIPKEKANA